MSTTEVTIADVSVEPVRTRAFPLGSYDRKPQRVIGYEWTVRTEANGDEITVELHCGHTHGRYFATVNNERRQPDGSAGVMPFNAHRLLIEPCERYSRKSFIDFAARALELLRRDAGELGAYLRGELAPGA